LEHPSHHILHPLPIHALYNALFKPRMCRYNPSPEFDNLICVVKESMLCSNRDDSRFPGLKALRFFANDNSKGAI
jgi:hypothetical protein